MNVSHYTYRQLEQEAMSFRIKVRDQLKAKGIKEKPVFGMWTIAIGETTRLQMQWHCGTLSGTESMIL